MKIEKNAMQLYAITDRNWLNGNTLASQVEEALRGGATFLQLREKNASKEEIIKEALEIKEICKKYNVPFVIDDDVDIAKEVNADGVHIGQNDASYTYARDILGDNKIIGMVNIRLYLNESLRREGGHIGYGIRPTERRKGYNKINLYLGLLEAKKLGLENVTLACESTNIASIKTIESHTRDDYFKELAKIYVPEVPTSYVINL